MNQMNQHVENQRSRPGRPSWKLQPPTPNLGPSTSMPTPNFQSYWKEWFFEDPLYGPQLGGYYSELSGIHFATVRGAGHEVPAYKPAAAYELMKRFLSLDHTGFPTEGKRPTDRSLPLNLKLKLGLSLSSVELEI